MTIPRNGFKAALRRGQLQIGLWSGLADPCCAELLANSGFDWMMLDGEHSPNDLRILLAQLQAMAPYPTHPVIRPPVGDWIVIKQLLDIGAQTLLIPMVESVEQARTLARAMRYPPAGVRGIGGQTTRATRWGRVDKYLHHADAQVCLLVQVETRAGLANLEAIAAVDGVDGVFVGPADLSASLGMLGKSGAPEAQPAIEEALRRVIKTGKPAGILTPDERLARRYISLGCTFVAVGIDTMLLAQATEALAGRFKEQGKRPGTHAAAWVAKGKRQK